MRNLSSTICNHRQQHYSLKKRTLSSTPSFFSFQWVRYDGISLRQLMCTSLHLHSLRLQFVHNYLRFFKQCLHCTFLRLPQALNRGLRGLSPNKHSPSGGVLCTQNAVLAIPESLISALLCSYFRNNLFFRTKLIHIAQNLSLMQNLKHMRCCRLWLQIVFDKFRIRQGAFKYSTQHRSITFSERLCSS